MPLQAQSFLRFSSSGLPPLPVTQTSPTLIHTLGGTHPRRTPTRARTPACTIQPPGSQPPTLSPPRETATFCLAQRPPPGSLLEHTIHTEPLNGPRSSDKALPTPVLRDALLPSPFIIPGSQTSRTHLPSWHTVPPLLDTHAHACTPSQTHQPLPAT